MSFRLSKQEAALRAINLAQSSIAAMSTNGWQWEIGDASPELPNANQGGRKVPRKWTVSIMWSKEGTPLDGPGTIVVDIESGIVQLVEGP